MKKIQIILPVAALFLAVSCQKENIMTWSGDDRIRFRTDLVNDTLQGYSFLGETSTVTQHVMHIEVNVEGQVRDFPRTVTLRQVATGKNDAVAGTHYVAFTDAQVKDQYVIPAGAATAKIPIILIRHAALLDNEKILRVELVANEYFRLTTDGDRAFRRITFAEKPAMPDVWNIAFVSIYDASAPYFGTYGPAKHRFMIDQTNTAFDNDWFSEYFISAMVSATGQPCVVPRDTGYASYLRQLLQQKLDAQNAAAGIGNELKETDGTIVKFL